MVVVVLERVFELGFYFFIVWRLKIGFLVGMWEFFNIIVEFSLLEIGMFIVLSNFLESELGIILE